MQTRIISATICASRSIVFNFLADVENLSKWAPGFAERIELRHNGWWAYTLRGEIFVELDVDDRTGVIDLRMGQSGTQVETLPVRVLPLSPRKTLVYVVLLQSEGQSPEQYELQYQALVLSVRHLVHQLGGGKLNEVESALRLDAKGLN